MHSSSPWVDPLSRTGLTSIQAGLQRAAEAARSRDSVLPDPTPAGLEERPGLPSGPELLPDEGISREELFDELEGLIRSSTLVGRPGWIGHMDPSPTWASVLGAAAAALVNNNMLMTEMSPGFSALEQRVVGELAREIGLGPRSGGTFTAGGSLANLLAITVARNDRLERIHRKGGSWSAELDRLTVMTSEDAHVSASKAAMVLGLSPKDGVLSVPTDSDGRLDASAVARAIDRAEARGRRCFCLVATAGTTVLGAVDPLADLAEVCRRHSVWFHVDAAYGGALVLSRGERRRLRGIERADSVALNPQKWLYVAKVCALVFFADRERWHRAMANSLPYALPNAESGSRSAAQIEGTRHADVLKLWLSLRQMGRQGVEERLRHSFRLARRCEAEVRKRSFLRLAAEPDTNIVVFGCLDAEGKLDEPRTVAVQGRLLEETDVFLSLPEYRGSRWLRAVFLNADTDFATIDRMFETIDSIAREEISP